MPPDVMFTNNSVYGAMDKVFLTHLESDHILRLPELLLRPWVPGRDQPMKVIGLKGTQGLVDNGLAAFKDDFDHGLNDTPGQCRRLQGRGNRDKRDADSLSGRQGGRESVPSAPWQLGRWHVLRLSGRTPQ